MPVGFEAVIHASLAFIELMVLLSWLTYRNGIKLPGVNLIGSIVTSFEYLFIANFRNSVASYPINGISIKILASCSMIIEIKKAPPEAETSGGAVIFRRIY